MADLSWKETFYRERLQVYTTKTKQNEKLYEFLEEMLPSDFQKSGIDFTQRMTLHILSVGSGDGITDFEILKILKKILEKQGMAASVRVFNRAIEPNANALDIYKQRVLNPPNEIRDVVFELCPPTTFEDYTSEQKGKFDVVHFIHSLYDIDIEKALVDCYYNELGERGMIIICLAWKNDLTSTVYGKGSGMGVRYDRSNTTITSVIEKHAWRFQEYTKKHEYDISEIFDEKSRDGNFFLDFIRFEINFRENYDPKEVASFLDLIKEFTVCRDGKYFATSEQRILIILK